MRLPLTPALLLGLALVASPAPAQPRKARTTERSLNGIPPGDGPLLATLQTSAGKIVVRLYERETPATVAHFVGLATGTREWRHPRTGERETGRPLYDGTVVHRMVPNFMIQLGDPLSHPRDGDPARVGTGDPGFHVDDELVPSLRFDRPALVAMANTDQPNTAGCQFFITEVALPHLNGRHTIFGEVVEGFELVPKIARSALAQGRVTGPVTLERVLISRGRK
jgi:peptidyl-prolyl cis-trans isomerase A (cyclophilin A)